MCMRDYSSPIFDADFFAPIGNERERERDTFVCLFVVVACARYD